MKVEYDRKKRIEELRQEHGVLPASRIAKKEAIQYHLDSAESCLLNSNKISHILAVLRIMNE